MLKVSVICFAVILCLFAQVQSIKIQKSHHMISHQMRRIVQHNIGILIHRFDARSSEGQDFIKRFATFALADDEISKALMTPAGQYPQPLSQGAADRVKNFFGDSEYFRDSTLDTVFSKLPDGNCLKDMSATERDRFMELTLNQIDFKRVFMKVTPETITKKDGLQLSKKMKDDPILKSVFEKCPQPNL